MRKAAIIFVYFLFVRVAYILLSGFDTCQLCADCGWINMLSERVLAGNFDFDVGRFIVSPFYNIFIAAHKFMFRDFWSIALIISQLALSSLSGVYFYKLGKLLFNEKQALISTLIFGVFPLTLYWVHTFCTESIFQSLLIISVYFLVKSVESKNYRDLIISAVIYSITFLTKSHILLYSPFIALFLFLNNNSLKKWTFPVLYGSISLLFTLPFGLFNLYHHDQYVLSSNGSNFQIYMGNSDYGYRLVVDVPPSESEEYDHLMMMRMSYFNGKIDNEIMKKPQAIKQSEYLDAAVNWIKKNPQKFLELKIYDLGFFLIPGVSFRHHSFTNWLFSFLISLPIYILGYIGIYRCLKSDFKKHFFSLGLFLSMLLFSVIWFVQNRFRTITIEPIYILYSGFVLSTLIEKIKTVNKSD